MNFWLGLKRQQPQIKLAVALGSATVLCLGLLAVREWVFGRYGLTWLRWNLGLAVLPALAAWVAYNLNAYLRRGRTALVSVCGLFWLAFLPNAPYLITDLIHFRVGVTGVPYWFDLILFIAFAWTGTMLGIVSLLMMQSVVRQHYGWSASWLFALCVLALNSFGVFLGRFQRWNSWDVLTNPYSLFADIAARFLHPTAHLRTFGFTALFGAMFSIFYLTIIALGDWQKAEREV